MAQMLEEISYERYLGMNTFLFFCTFSFTKIINVLFFFSSVFFKSARTQCSYIDTKKLQLLKSLYHVQINNLSYQFPCYRYPYMISICLGYNSAKKCSVLKYENRGIGVFNIPICVHIHPHLRYPPLENAFLFLFFFCFFLY